MVPERRWVYGGQESIEGEIKEARIEAGVLGLKPLELKREGTWDPKEMDWGEEGPYSRGVDEDAAGECAREATAV